MLGWLWRMIVGRFDACEHMWECEEKHKLTDDNGRVYGLKVILRCTECGDYCSREL